MRASEAPSDCSLSHIMLTDTVFQGLFSIEVGVPADSADYEDVNIFSYA